MRVGLFYDWDLTLNEECPQLIIFRKYFSKLRDKYGINKPEEFWEIYHKSEHPELEVGYMEQMISDAKDVFEGLTNKIMEEEFASKTKLAPGLQDWFPRINQFAAEKGIELEHHVVSVGTLPLIKGTSISPYFTSINAGEFLDDGKSIYRIKKVVDSFRKVSIIKSICKGVDLHEDIPLEDYHILHRHSIVFGDGQSDRDMFRYIRQRGGFAIGVFEKDNGDKFDRLIDVLNAEDPYKSSINIIAPRDYSKDSRIENKVKQILIQMKQSESKCDMDYEIVHNSKLNHLKNKEIIDIAEKHFKSCKFCRSRFYPKICFR